MLGSWTIASGGKRMLDSDFLNNVAVLVVAVIVGLIGYFRRPRKKGVTTTMTAIGLGWLEREQTERMLSSIDGQAKAQVRMAEALEAMADKKANEMTDQLKELVEQVDTLLDAKPKPTHRPRPRR